MNRLTKRGSTDIKKTYFANDLHRLCDMRSDYCQKKVCDRRADRSCPYLQCMDRLAAYEDTGLEPEVVKDMAENAETRLLAWFEARYNMPVGKLMDLIEAQQDGRVVVLPCKVGDVVYEVHNNTAACTMCRYREGIYGSGEDWCTKIEDIDLRYYPTIAEKPLCEKQFMEVVERTPKIDWIFHHRAEFGKTVFLTREEAEKALAEEAAQ